MRVSQRYTWQALLTMIALTGLAMTMLSGCSKPAEQSGSAKNKETVVVMKGDADKTVNASPGQTLEVVLDANPSTGFTWTVASAPEFMKSEGEPTFESGAKSGEVGAGGKQTLKFSITATGKDELSLNYVRPWETGTAPAETFKVEVESK